MKSKWIIGVCAAVLATTLCACQAAPEKEIVVNKNVENFEALIRQQADGPMESVEISKHNTFSSVDGKIEIIWDVDTTLEKEAYPVIEVSPHELTEAKVKHVSEVLFPGCKFYDYGHENNRDSLYAKGYYQKLINRLLPYTDKEAYQEMYGSLDGMQGLLEEIDWMTKCMETAPALPQLPVCDWKYKHPGDYLFFQGNPWDQLLIAATDTGEADYILQASHGYGQLHYFNNLLVKLQSASSYADQILYAQYCRTAPPTQTQIDQAKEKGQALLDKLGIGSWQVTKADIVEEKIGHTITEYQIELEARPLLNEYVGESVQKKSGGGTDEFSPSYPISRARIDFSADGHLIWLSIASPIDLEKVVNENVKILPFDTLCEKIETQLSFWEPNEADQEQIDNCKNYYHEELAGRLKITGLQYGLGRVSVPNKKAHYYYLPVLVAEGTVEYYGTKSGTVYIPAEETAKELIVINAVDGSLA